MKMNAEDAAGPAHARPTAPSSTLGLDRLPRSVPAHVAALQPARDDREQALVQRLMEIGFLPGEPVRVVASGFPGGDPLAVRIGQATFALRRHEAALVQVQPEAAA
ncbi:ferrous iron transport protein A [Paracidovorax citrulli]|uniref:FeoA family protein n=2 Tax=Paracidovorax citrulli TaxID=80869 RepID=A1TLB4_PARC0|nr:ferrous iron transport protein A [Paracidovorax citrulli]ABM31752.1 FeoA family protein [Paracidovorax citrulli AAC00-1]ATG95177.1 ferrous iron transport protein A [Paracidovorax citrulli]MVT29288.1 ferrous iron transport protein A [Paracidovorax citrulli]MVT38271.1 ferrous iron transport protein A [Paracidovorax citrulli]PVY65938.1 ferrous iron transport protein A [Paracidovorax citrulli]